jgi:hypothetical protein
MPKAICQETSVPKNTPDKKANNAPARIILRFIEQKKGGEYTINREKREL